MSEAKSAPSVKDSHSVRWLNENQVSTASEACWQNVNHGNKAVVKKM